MVAIHHDWFNEGTTPEIHSCGSTGPTAKVFLRCSTLGFRFLPLSGETVECAALK